MQIWVDADACPNVIKEILFRAAERLHIRTTLVANQPLRIPPSLYIKTIQVQAGFDVADNRIVQDLQAGDLVITADIPLAAEEMRNSGVMTGGPATLSLSDRQAFANQLDRFLTKHGVTPRKV